MTLAMPVTLDDVRRKPAATSLPRLGIFSKMHVPGGSERRCIEMANSLFQRGGWAVDLLCERSFSSQLRDLVMPEVRIIPHWLVESHAESPQAEDLAGLLVVNTDSKEFCTRQFWEARRDAQGRMLKLDQLRQLVFLFNFIVSPSRQLTSMAEVCPRLKIITANRKFFDEIDDQDRYVGVRALPRLILESPIDPQSVSAIKLPNERVRIGCHGSPYGDKWNTEWPQLIQRVNDLCGPERVEWRFLGMVKEVAGEVATIANVTVHPTWSVPVKSFLEELDVCISFPSWKREEAWSRSLAEALLSGCPVLTTPRGGNRDQVHSGVNGWHCRSLDDFVRRTVALLKNPDQRTEMSQQARRLAAAFESPRVIEKFLTFLAEE